MARKKKNRSSLLNQRERKILSEYANELQKLKLREARQRAYIEQQNNKAKKEARGLG